MDISFLLFSSMLQPTEQYLSREIKDKPISKNTIQNLKCAISKAIDKQKGLFKKKAALEKDSIDHEIEMTIANVRNPKHEDIIDGLFIEGTAKDSDSTVRDYETKANISSEIKSAFKSLYQTFVSSKGTYTKAYKSIQTTTRKIIEGPVRMTTEKFCKVGQYIMAAICPQWNTPTLSKMDFDTLSVQIANHIIIGEEGIKYNSAYSTLRYWHN